VGSAFATGAASGPPGLSLGVGVLDVLLDAGPLGAEAADGAAVDVDDGGEGAPRPPPALAHWRSPGQPHRHQYHHRSLVYFRVCGAFAYWAGCVNTRPQYRQWRS